MRYDHFLMLPEKAFQPRNGRFSMTLEGGSSGGGSSAPSSTSQTTIPEYAKPYMEKLLGKAEAASEAPYQTYGGERLTGPTAEQQAARGEVAGLKTPGEFTGATAFTGAGGLGSLGAGQNYFGLATSPAAQQAFMSPYMQNVVDVQKQEALRDAQKGQLAQNLAAGRAGTYGGARQLLATTERERNLQDQMAQIQASGSQRAFEAAQQAQQFGSELGLRGYGQAIQAGAGLGQIGVAKQQADLDRLRAQEAAGGLGQQEQQAKLDLAYQDFLAQQRYPYTQLGFMSDILRGSGNLAGTGGRAIYEAPPSTGSQLLGLASSLGGAYLAGGRKFAEGGEVKGLDGIEGYAAGGSIIDDMVDVEKLTPEQIKDTRSTGARRDVPDYVLLGELQAKLNEIEQAKAQGIPDTTVAEDIRAQAMQEIGGGVDSIPIPDDYFGTEEEVAQLAGGGVVAFANGGGIKYNDGSVGYPFGGLIAPLAAAAARFGPSAYRAAQIGPKLPSSYSLGAADKAILGTVGAAGRGVLGLGKSIVRNPLTAGAVGYGALEYMTEEPEAPKAETKEEPKKEEPKKEDAKAGVSDKDVKRVAKAEDAYEKALKAELDKTNMSEDDKLEAVGFALMKAGAKTMAGKSRYAMQNIGEGIEAGVDDYVKTLNQSKKDKRQLTKDLAEYGLAKEKNRIAEQSAAAQLAQSEAAMIRAERTGAQAERTALIKAWQDEMKTTAPKDRLPFPAWLQSQGFAGGQGAGPAAGADIRQFYKK